MDACSLSLDWLLLAVLVGAAIGGGLTSLPTHWRTRK